MRVAFVEGLLPRKPFTLKLQKVLHAVYTSPSDAPGWIETRDRTTMCGRVFRCTYDECDIESIDCVDCIAKLIELSDA